VDVQGDYYALCPYASRVPFEIWILHRRHNHLSSSRGRERIGGSSPRSLAGCCAALKKSPPLFILWFTPRRTRATGRGTFRVLEDPCRGLPLAHRDHADP